jgi:hypothetical protein
MSRKAKAESRLQPQTKKNEGQATGGDATAKKRTIDFGDA